MPELKKTIITGGGFAGLAAAYWCRRLDPAGEVILVEREERLLPWLDRKGLGAIPLGTVTETETWLEADYPRLPPQAADLLRKWPGPANRSWLESLGIEVREGPGSAFLATGGRQLRAVWEAVLKECGVRVVYGFSLESVSPQPDGTVRLWSRGGQAEQAQRLLLATGGGRNHGLALAREQGMEEVPVFPAYVRLRLASPKLGEQLGGPAREIGVRCPRTGKKAVGESTFSSRGLEGEALSRLSAQLCADWEERSYRIPLEIDWIPGTSPASLRADFLSRCQMSKRKPIGEEPLYSFSGRQWAAFLGLSRIDPENPWMRVKERQFQTLIQRLKGHLVNFDGLGLPAGERAWAGGIAGDGIDWSTGQSRTARGLYFAGEILDLLGAPGGAHLNLIWATGYLAGSALAT